jgi:hypothetical protein
MDFGKRAILLTKVCFPIEGGNSPGYPLLNSDMSRGQGRMTFETYSTVQLGRSVADEQMETENSKHL